MPQAGTARLVEIVGEAMTRPPEEREALVRAACPDPRQREEAMSLLAALARAGAFMETPTLGPQAAQPSDSGVREAPGAMVGRYKLLEQIGEGGFGVVFLAEQREPVQRRVALKIIKPGMDTRAVVARFEQERQALALMDHPNIAKVLDAGATDTGRPYFVMELVKGEPITEFCDRETLPISERITLFAQVCGAVQHAHLKGVIHRDLKPGNILVSVHDGRPIPKVIDFGIAKAIDRRLTDKTVYTEFRQLIGTPEYMSPEQAEGSLDIDTRSDVYSLGVLLYELLTGSPPFDPLRLRSANYAEIQRLICEVDPPKPSTRLSQSRATLVAIASRRRTDPARLGTLVRGDLDWIAMRALEKDRSRRYDSAGALAADLQRYLDGRPIEAAPPSTIYRARKFVSRHRGPVVAAALLAIALIAGTVGTAIGLFQARASKHRADDQAARADREAADAKSSARAADSVNELMTKMIERADRGRQAGRADITVREVMDAAAKELESHGDAYEPQVAMRLAKAIGGTYRELTLLEPAERMLRLHTEKERTLHGESSPEYAAALNDLGAVLKASGDLDGAAGLYAQAAAIADSRGEPAAKVRALVRVNNAALVTARGDTTTAVAELRKAIAYFESAGDTQDRDYVLAVNNIAAVFYDQGKIDDAEQNLMKSIQLRRASPRGMDSDGLTALHNLAALRYAKGDRVKAEETMREEVDAARALYGDVHLDLANALEGLAVVLAGRKDYDGAERAERESLAIYRALHPPEHPAIGRALKGLGGTLEDQGKADEAESAYAEACRILDIKPGPGHPDALISHYELAVLMQRRGDAPAAERSLSGLLDAAESSLPEGSPFAWVRYALQSLSGSLIVDQASNPQFGADERARRFAQAEPLIVPNIERLQKAGGRLGPNTRRAFVDAAMERAVRLYDAWSRADPTSQHAASLEEWRGKLETHRKKP